MILNKALGYIVWLSDIHGLLIKEVIGKFIYKNYEIEVIKITL